MTEQTEKLRSRQYQIFFIPPYLLEIFSAILLALVMIISPGNSNTYSLSTQDQSRSTQPFSKLIPAWVITDHTGIYSTPGSTPAIAYVSQHTSVFLTGDWQRVNKTD